MDTYQRSEVSYLCGLDLGQQHDYTALAIAEYYRPDGPTACPQYDVRHIERMPLGTSYPTVVSRIHTLLNAPRLKDHVELIVDGTGVGRPVVDMLRQAGLKPVAVSIHGGDAVEPRISRLRLGPRAETGLDRCCPGCPACPAAPDCGRASDGVDPHSGDAELPCDDRPAYRA